MGEPATRERVAGEKCPECQQEDADDEQISWLPGVPIAHRKGRGNGRAVGLRFDGSLGAALGHRYVTR